MFRAKFKFPICNYPKQSAKMTTHIANKTSLPTRERIIALWAEGESNNNIATRFGITRHTVSNIVGNMMERGHLSPS
jgi:DNA-binding NarL/FixJ family response regulator